MKTKTQPIIEYRVNRTKRLADLVAGDVPRGLDPSDVALPEPSPKPEEPRKLEKEL